MVWNQNKMIQSFGRYIYTDISIYLMKSKSINTARQWRMWFLTAELVVRAHTMNYCSLKINWSHLSLTTGAVEQSIMHVGIKYLTNNGVEGSLPSRQLHNVVGNLWIIALFYKMHPNFTLNHRQKVTFLLYFLSILLFIFCVCFSSVCKFIFVLGLHL